MQAPEKYPVLVDMPRRGTEVWELANWRQGARMRPFSEVASWPPPAMTCEMGRLNKEEINGPTRSKPLPTSVLESGRLANWSSGVRLPCLLES